MGRLCALVLLIVGAVAIPTAAIAQDIVVDPNSLTADKINEALMKKGQGWLKGKAKSAGKDWIFETGQSDTMQAILEAAKVRATDGEGTDVRANCKGAVMGKASSILTNLGYVTNAKAGGKKMFDTATKMAGLASGFGGAIAEGGAINWLIGQYTDAAAGKAKDSVFDEIKKIFIDEKQPQFEIYEKDGTVGKCDYKLHAVWDIVHGTYSVLITGDCHCEPAGNTGVAPQKLGKWWITFKGHLKITVVTTKGEKTVKWVVLPVDEMKSDAQCDCSTRELTQPFVEKQKVCPPSAKPQISPEERAKIQADIDAKTQALEEEETKVAQIKAKYDGAKSAGDEKAMNEAKKESYDSEFKQSQLKKDIADLKKKLGDSPPGKPLGMILPPPTDPTAAALLAYHNKLRADVGSPPLQWSPALTGHAQGYARIIADSGQPEHSSRSGRETERENVSLGMRGVSNPLQLAEVWGAEQRYFRSGIFPDISTTDDWSDAGHYSQMVWSETTEVGCGFARGRRVDALVCRYSPPGNQDGEPVIRVGLTYEFAGQPCAPAYQETNVPMPELPNKETFEQKPPEKLDDPL
jgi:hypothetical protein